MKILLLSLVTFFSLEASSQAFYRTYKTDNFQNLIKHGIVYVKKGDSSDSLFVNAIEKYWDVSPYRIVDPQKEDKVTEDELVFIPHHEMVIVQAKMLKHQEISKTRTVGYTLNNGLGLDSSSEVGINLNVAFLNSCVNQINKNKIAGKSGQVND
jgi:hypothetical protein